MRILVAEGGAELSQALHRIDVRIDIIHDRVGEDLLLPRQTEIIFLRIVVAYDADLDRRKERRRELGAEYLGARRLIDRLRERREHRVVADDAVLHTRELADDPVERELERLVHGIKRQIAVFQRGGVSAT